MPSLIFSNYPTSSRKRPTLLPVVKPVVKRPKVECTRKTFSCSKSPAVINPSYFVACLNPVECSCSRFFNKIINIFYEDIKGEPDAERLLILMDADTELEVVGKEDKLEMHIEDVDGKKAIIVIDINALKNEREDIKEIKFEVVALGYDMTDEKFNYEYDAEDTKEDEEVELTIYVSE